MPRRARPLLALCLALLLGTGAQAENILRRSRAEQAAAPPGSADAAASAALAAQRAAASGQADNPLRQALQAIDAFKQAQAAARAAALGAASTVPNGLAPGGLVVDPGVATDPSKWQGAGLPGQSQGSDGRTEVTITQSRQKAILTWETFNVGRETDVHFDQTAGGSNVASWIALNRVLDPSLKPSQILGSIRAEGQVYVLNRNGILFGGSSQVNVSALVVSGLDLVGGDDRFRAGILADTSRPTFAGPGGSVTVEAGAQISAGNYGQVLLIGAGVKNGGTLQAPDGQVVLVGGDQVFLAPSLDTAIRGYAVRISGGQPVENTGLVSTPRGNITLNGGCPGGGNGCVGIAQRGILQATTSAAANGSILIGTDRVQVEAQTEFTQVEFGPGSRTQILPDDGDAKFAGYDEQSFVRSSLRVVGHTVTLLDGAKVYLPSGTVDLITRLDPGQSGVPDDTRIYLAPAASIDVSGLREVKVAMEQNTITAQLRANELNDNPVLRNSPLRGRTVSFDARLGTGVANLSGYYDLVERNVQELMVRGGTIRLSSNEVITRSGSVLDLSGGSVQFQDGYVSSSVLVDPTGKRVRIEDAKPGVAYRGLDGDFVVDHARWGIKETYGSAFSGTRRRFEKGYVQGASAGSLVVTKEVVPRPPGATVDVEPVGAYRIFDGTLRTDVVVGPKQRELPSSASSPSDPTRAWRERPASGNVSLNQAGNLTIAQDPIPLPASFGPSTPLDPASRYDVVLPARWFDGKTLFAFGFANPVTTQDAPLDPGEPRANDNVSPGGHLTIGRGVVVGLAEGGSFTFGGKSADIDGTLLVPGGSVRLTTNNKSAGGSETALSLRLGPTGSIDVAGRWTNDALDGADKPYQALSGGSVVLQSSNIFLAPGSLIDVSGGARLDPGGTRLTAGAAGSITLDISIPPDPALGPSEPSRFPYAQSLSLGSELRGFSFATGGTLAIRTSLALVIGTNLPPTAVGALLVRPDFFTGGGFSRFSLLGEQGVTVTSGTVVKPEVQSFLAPSAPAEIPTGSKLFDFAARQVLAPEFQRPVSLELSARPTRGIPASNRPVPVPFSQSLVVEKGAEIRLSPGSSVSLSSIGTLFVDGLIEVPGGTISLAGLDPTANVSPIGVPDVKLGPDARLLAPGYVASTLQSGQVRRTVQSAGTITVSTNTRLLVDPGAVLDVSGIGALSDLPPAPGAGDGLFVPVLVSGSAGSITLTGGTGVLAGQFRLGAGAPGVDGQLGSGGSLTVSASGINQGLTVRQGIPTRFGPVTRDSTTSETTLVVVADRLDASRADDLGLFLASPGTALQPASYRPLIFDGPVDLRAGRSLTVSAPVLLSSGSGDVRLSAPNVRLVGGALAIPRTATAARLDATLTVEADLIDLEDTLFLGCPGPPCTAGGFGTARFVARRDIRLGDHTADGALSTNAGLFSAGALSFESAQVYVTRLIDPVLVGPGPGFVVESPSEISMKGNGGPAPVPFSYGNVLTFRAPRIEQGGTVRAPQGRIVFEATGPDGQVDLLPGSLTSTSLEGAAVPFNTDPGQVLTGGTFVAYSTPGASPEKSVRLQAPRVAVQPGAVVDVSGGGDLVGYTFVAGNGGSKDILRTPGAFAIVPARGNAPLTAGGTGTLYDPSIRPGDVVFLKGVPNLADGYYTVLPAQYAIVPGALLVQPLAGTYASAPSTTIAPDGSVYAAGYRATDGSSIRAAGWSRFRVMSNQTFSQYSDLRTYSFNTFARSIAAEAGVLVRVPDDGGALVLDASRSLVLQGTGRFSAGPDALQGTVDISAPKIALVGSGISAPDSSYLSLDVGALQALGAGSILLGGTRSLVTGTEQSGTAVSVNASQVRVDTGPGSAWSGPEIILVARDAVTVADGSILRAQGATLRDGSPLLLQGDSAVLRLSTGTRVGIVRSDPPLGTPAGAGALVVGNAELSAQGSLSLYGSRSVALGPQARFSAQLLDLAATRINLGDVPAGTEGVTLSSEALARLGSSSDLLLRGTDSIHLYAGLSLGGRDGSGVATLKQLTLDSGLIQAEGGVGGSRVTAGQLTLQSSGGGGAPAAGNGSLTVDVDVLRLGPGSVQLGGVTALQGRAGAIEIQGSGGLTLPGDFAVSTAQVRARSGASYELRASGNLSLTSGVGEVVAGGLGGRLLLSGSTVLLDTAIALPAGELEAVAAGGGLRIGSAARLDLAGRAVTLVDRTELAPAGSIRLTTIGDLNIAQGAVLDVTPPAAGGAGGTIALTSGGASTVGGDLRGGSGAAFALDSVSIADLSGLNARLQGAGFDGARSYRLRQGDLVVGSGDQITAHTVLLRADTGQVSIAGRILSAGTDRSPAGGRVQLIGGTGLTLLGTAVIDARATQAAPDGFEPASGSVELAAGQGRVTIASGALIDVTGGATPGGGQITLRAPRLGPDVAIDPIAGTLRGRQVVVQGSASYQASVVDAALAARLVADAATWLQGEAAVRTRLLGGGGSLPTLVVAPAMDVSAPGNLVVQSAVSLVGLGRPGRLSLQAGGTLTVDASISDGFASVDPAAALGSGLSSSLLLDAGGDVVVGPGALVRTGTGDIEVRAGRDLVFASPTSVLYTAGQRTPVSPGFAGATGDYPTLGGDVRLQAGRDVIAPLATQSTSGWLFRAGDILWTGDPSTSTVRTQTSWSVVFANFRSGVGALGGGDIDIAAGRDVVRLQAAIPSTGQLTTPVGGSPQASDLVVRGGGDLRLDAGRDVLGGIVVLGRGTGTLRAGGRIGPSQDLLGLRTAVEGSNLGSVRTLAPLVGLMDASVELVAAGPVEVEAGFDPMRQGQVVANKPGGVGAAFVGYTERTSLSAISLGGPVRYRNDPWATVDLTANSLAADRVRMTGAGTLNSLFSEAPPTLRLVSLADDVLLRDPFLTPSTLTLGSADRGTLEALALKDLRVQLVSVLLTDEPRAYRRGPLLAFSTTGTVDTPNLTPTGAVVPLPRAHVNDPDPVRLYAQNGSLCTYINGSCAPVASSGVQVASFVPNKALQVFAGRDVVAGAFTAINWSDQGFSEIRSGRDVFDVQFNLLGTGTLLVEAGRNVVEHAYSSRPDAPLGGLLIAQGNGVRPGSTVTQNQNLLPSGRAGSIVVVGGAAKGIDVDRFAAAYLDPSNAAGVVRTYVTELRTYMTSLGYGSLSDAELVAAFATLPVARREVFLYGVYFNELKETGIDYNDPASPRYQSYNRGFRAVALLFSGAADAPGGDVLLAGKPLETWAQGDITVVAPYGRIGVGTDVGGSSSAGGVVTRRGGSIRLMADANVDLFTSRVFTLQGGDITMWTSNGSITAGAGSKTSVRSVPLTYLTSNDGVVTVNLFGLQTGAGIGVLDAAQGTGPRPRSRLDLIAPRGEVNAGDAGIRVVGDLNIAAQVVVGVENIQVTGSAVGVPKVTQVNVAALTSASQLTQAAAKEGVGSAAAPRTAVKDLPSIVTVEVVGYETTDKTPGATEEEKKKKKGK